MLLFREAVVEKGDTPWYFVPFPRRWVGPVQKSPYEHHIRIYA